MNSFTSPIIVYLVWSKSFEICSSSKLLIYKAIDNKIEYQLWLLRYYIIKTISTTENSWKPLCFVDVLSMLKSSILFIYCQAL